MSEIEALARSVIDGAYVRAMDDEDRAMRTGGSMRLRRFVSVVFLLVSVVGGLLVATSAAPEVTVPILTLWAVLGGVVIVLSQRTRRRLVRVVAWLGDIDFRLAQLAARG